MVLDQGKCISFVFYGEGEYSDMFSCLPFSSFPNSFLPFFFYFVFLVSAVNLCNRWCSTMTIPSQHLTVEVKLSKAMSRFLPYALRIKLFKDWEGCLSKFSFANFFWINWQWVKLSRLSSCPFELAEKSSF